MTEVEFLRQVWRPYDRVIIEGNDTQYAVVNICFTTRSVRININGTSEWFRCDSIERHITKTGDVDDASIIENLHNRLMSANDRNDNLQRIVDEQRQKIQELLNASTSVQIEKLVKALNRVEGAIRPTKKAIEAVDSLVDFVNKLDIEEILKESKV